MMEMKIFLLLLLVMEISLEAIALPFHGSLVVAEASPSSNPIIHSHPYSTKLPNNTSSHHNKRVQARKRPASPPPQQRKKPRHHKWIPAKAANPHHHQSIALPPSLSPSQDPVENRARGPVSSPSSPYISYHRHRPRSTRQGPALPPSSRIPSPPASAPALSPSSTSSAHSNVVIISPSVAPLGSIHGSAKASPPLIPILALPPPPPNADCSSVTCTEPLTYTTTGSPCGCVQPMQVKLHLDVAIYTFFPQVSELAEEIASGVGLNHSQVRIMGADAATQELEKTAVLVNLVPRGGRFDYVTAFHIYDRFWHRQVPIKDSIFGNYEVIYVHYPGLPPSPPPAPLGISTTDDGPYRGQNDHGNPMKPLGVNIAKTKRDGPGKRMIVVIAVSSFTAFVVLLAICWVLLARFKPRRDEETNNDILIPTPPKPANIAITARTTPRGGGSSSAVESVSLSSGTMTYTGSAKIFTLSEMERATEGFNSGRVVGEGGFGLVYSGALDDGRKVAVKVLKREGGHHGGGREFLAEVEMLSRLHHRNLVKLIGICTEGQARCLVYELVPNGSLESHLHGVDKEGGDPLDWDARMKIALGAARGLAYLHEDSNPRVIHRDFKSSNILLEHDFTPKVSDFGLARSALEGNTHISTHVMGTFGYLAPEYAMTGHLLVKSDVYSYGVVLLELLTGRKPVDLSQPPGQENLVSWVRPLLTNKEALETILDPSLNPPADPTTVAKVAAIASMCVQPEVAHRPFMGEVVQALKLVCNEFDEASKGLASASRVYSSQDRTSSASSTTFARAEIIASHDHDNNDDIDNNNNNNNNNGALLILPTSELMSEARMGNVERQEDLGSFRRHSSSGPLVSSDGQTRRFWQRLRSLSWGSVGEHGLPKIWSASR